VCFVLLLLSYLVEYAHQRPNNLSHCPKGPFIKDVRKMFGILDPSPLVRTLARSIRVNPRNLPYYVCFWANPLSPLGADVLYEWSLKAVE